MKKWIKQTLLFTVIYSIIFLLYNLVFKGIKLNALDWKYYLFYLCLYLIVSIIIGLTKYKKGSGKKL